MDYTDLAEELEVCEELRDLSWIAGSVLTILVIVGAGADSIN